MTRTRHALIAATLAAFAFAAPARSQTADTSRIHMGMNLAGPSDYGSEWPFVDVMKYARPWTLQNSVWMDGGENPWDYPQYVDSMEVDEQGWPLEVPFAVQGADTSLIAVAVWSNTSDMPHGHYTVLYEGEGTIAWQFDASIVSQEPGRQVIDVGGSNDIMLMKITRSVRGNHIRNVRVLMPGTEDTYVSEPYYDKWLEKVAPFPVVRYMDWGITNNSSLSQWPGRALEGDYTWTIDGIPYEVMARTANRIGADVWVCVPHLATDTYIRNMARVFRDSLDAERTVYVEFSNEVWNWMFQQTQYLHDQGDQSEPWPERIVPFIQNALDIWSEEFAGQDHRLVRVVGVQAGYQDVSNRIAENLTPGSFDMVSPAAYFHFTSAGYAALADAGASADADLVLQYAREGMVEAATYIRNQGDLAQRLGVSMGFYEGGQHLTPDPFGTDQPYNPALVAANTDPRMYDLYMEWFAMLKQEYPGEMLFMNFSFVTPTSGKYGSWGALTSIDVQPPYRQTAPKYAALLDMINGVTASVAQDPGSRSALPEGLVLDGAWPNPFNPATTLTYSLSHPAEVRVEVFDVLGRRVALLANHPHRAGRHRVAWHAGGRASGVYHVRASIPGGVARVKRILLLK